MLLALTGGVASGKSTLARLLTQRHTLEFFDADACVHELLSANDQVRSAVSARFGPGVQTDNGSLNREALRGIVFHDLVARRDLEAILHPLVREAWQGQAASCRAEGRDFLADIPLLFETGAEKAFDCSVLVAASEATQLQRLANRGVEAPTAQAMLASQLAIGEKIARADCVIWNDGTLEALSRQADLLLERLFATTHAGSCLPY
jgi:dephospho-CoA kinase